MMNWIFLVLNVEFSHEPYNESDTEMWYQSDTNYEIDSMWGGFWRKIDYKISWFFRTIANLRIQWLVGAERITTHPHTEPFSKITFCNIRCLQNSYFHHTEPISLRVELKVELHNHQNNSLSQNFQVNSPHSCKITQILVQINIPTSSILLLVLRKRWKTFYTFFWFSVLVSLFSRVGKKVMEVRAARHQVIMKLTEIQATPAHLKIQKLL